MSLDQRVSHSFAWLVFATICLVSTHVSAQSFVDSPSTAFDTSTLKLLGARSTGSTLLPGARALDTGAWEASWVYGFEGQIADATFRTPLVRGGEIVEDVIWIGSRHVGHAQFAFAPFERIELSLGLPVLLHHDANPSVHTPTLATGTSTLGDARIGARYGVYQAEGRGLVWMLTTGLSAPTGQPEFAYAQTRARVDVSTSIGYDDPSIWGAEVHVGFASGTPGFIGTHAFGDTLWSGVSAHVDGWRFRFMAEGIARAVIADRPPGREISRVGMELLGSVRYRGETFFVDAGGGVGLRDAGATPEHRLVVGLGVQGRVHPPQTVVEVFVDDTLCAVVADRLHAMEIEVYDLRSSLDETSRCPRGFVRGEDGVCEPVEEPPVDCSATEACLAAGGVRCDADVVQEVTATAIFFETDVSTLDSVAADRVRYVASRMLALPGPVVVVGHADGSGDADYNERLSHQRAEAVVTALVAAGVPASSLSVRAEGSTRRLAHDETTFGRSVNRRVVFEWQSCCAPCP